MRARSLLSLIKNTMKSGRFTRDSTRLNPARPEKNRFALFGIGAFGTLAAYYITNTLREKQLETKLIESQKDLDRLNSAIKDDKESSYVIYSSKTQNNMFRGGLLEYLVKYKKLEHIDTILLTGEQINPGIFSSSIKWSENNFIDFMKAIADMKIKRLNLKGCELTPEIGVVLGEALKTNSSLEELVVTPNQLEKKGLIAILKGLEQNTSLKKFHCISYNVERYYWSSQELYALKDLIVANQSLEFIQLPNNQIGKVEHIQILIEPYRAIDDRKLMTIEGFGLSESVTIPKFSRENVLNNSLEECANIKFRK